MGDAVGVREHQFLIICLAVGRDGAALPAGDGLDGVETEAGHVGEAAHGGAVVTCSDGVGGILDEDQAELVAESADLPVPDGLAREVHGHDGLGPGRDAFPDTLGVDVVGLGIDVGEDGLRAAVHGAVGAGGEGHRRRDDLIAGADAGGEAGAVQGGRPVAAKHGMGGTRAGGEPALGLLHHGAAGDVGAAQHPGNLLDVLLVHALAAVVNLLGSDGRPAQYG